MKACERCTLAARARSFQGKLLGAILPLYRAYVKPESAT